MALTHGRRRKGAVLILFAFAISVIIGATGLAVDLGRMYTVRNEAQSFVDAVALSEAARLIDAWTPRGEVFKRYHFNTESFNGLYTLTYFSGPSCCGGAGSPAPTSSSMFVRATATVPVPMYLMQVLTGQRTGTVSATATAGALQLQVIAEGGFPYGVRAPLGGLGGEGHLGFQKDRAYTFRWGNQAGADLENAWRYVISSPNSLSSPSCGADPVGCWMDGLSATLRGGRPFGPSNLINNISPWCEGDADPRNLRAMYEQPIFNQFANARSLFSHNNAYFPMSQQGSGTASITDAIMFGYQAQILNLDGTGTVNIATGVRQATSNAIDDLIALEANGGAPQPVHNMNTDGYFAANNNGYRVIIAPLLDHVSAEASPSAVTIRGAAAFLLWTRQQGSSYRGDYGGPQFNWCATYIGGADIGSRQPVPNASAIYALRLIR